METATIEQSETATIRKTRSPGRTKLTRVRFVKSVAGARFDYVEGETAELEPSFAKEMIARGYARPA